jgi:Flp pilus assembly protein protease CpaA
MVMSELVTRAGLSIILVGLAIYDLKHTVVPNVVVMPLMLAVIPLTLLRLITDAVSWSQVGLIALAWGVCIFMQATRMLGGGDAKLAMALIGIFPDQWMIYTLLAVFLIGHLVILLGRDRWAGIQRVRRIVLSTLVTRQLPTREEIRAAAQARWRPVTYFVSLAGLLYLWLLHAASILIDKGH